MGMFSLFKGKEKSEKGNKLKNISISLSDFKFISSRLSKFEKGIETASIDDCWKGIQINKNSKDENSYSMKIFKLDRPKNKWSENAQMVIKQMKLKNISENKFELNGYGNDGMGVSFSDYGITVLIEKNSIVKIILKYFYRNTELHYSR